MSVRWSEQDLLAYNAARRKGGEPSKAGQSAKASHGLKAPQEVISESPPLVIVGIDPGRSGGIATLNQDGSLWLPTAIPMPETEKAIADYFWSQYLEAKEFDAELLCFLEHIQPMPIIKRTKTDTGEEREEVNPGLNQLGTFMKHYGFLRGCLVTIGIPIEDIRPQAWQRLLGCMTRGNKNVSKAKAQQLFPTLQVTHKVADALLIAEAGRKIRMGLSAGALFEGAKKQVMPWEAK